MAWSDVEGYGRFNAEGETHLAHRVSYTIFVSPIPVDNLIRHACDTPLCVQPWLHLLPGTHADNNRDMMERGRHGTLRGVQHGGLC